MGAVGAIVSVMMRMAAKSATGFVDYEVGRPSLTPGRELPADHRRRLRGRHLLRPEERHHPAVDRERAGHDLLLRDLRLHRGVQRAQGDGHPGRAERMLGGADPPADDEPQATNRREGPQRAGSRRSRLSVAGETATPESVVPDQPSGRDHARGRRRADAAPAQQRRRRLRLGGGGRRRGRGRGLDEVRRRRAKGAGRPKFGENELLTLRGRAEGRTAVRLVQRRTWEEGVAPIAAHALTVNVAAAEATKSGGTK